MDCVIKIFDLKEKSNKQSYDIVDEIRAIAYNSSKNILSYSQGKSVYLIKNMISFSDPVLVTSFTSPVIKISFNDKLDYLITMSEEDDIFLTNISSLLTYKHKYFMFLILELNMKDQ